MQVWILTFNRPAALSRLIEHFGEQGQKVNILSNHPELRVTPRAGTYIDKVVMNSANSPESNSWCARAWNTCYMKCFDVDDEGIFIQDDTDIGPNFMNWLNEQKQKYDFIWGPAGDQFHYMRKSVLQKTGWFDERYIGCYCGDAEYLKRVYMSIEPNRLSFEDSHNWGMFFNASGVSKNVITTYEAKTIDPDYDNQHWQLERDLCGGGRTDSNNPTLKHSQQHYRDKWGVDLDNGEPVIHHTTRKMPEIDWYPWFSKKHNFDPNWRTRSL